MPARTPGDGDAARQAELDDKAVQLRKAGVAYIEIADTLGVDVGTAYQMVQRGIASIPRESAEEITTLIKGQLEFVTGRLLSIMAGFHPVVNNGRVMVNPATGEIMDDPVPKIAAARMVIAASDRVARLYGLDAPRTSVTVNIDSVEAEIRKLESELGKAADPPGPDLTADRRKERRSDGPAAIEGPPGFR